MSGYGVTLGSNLVRSVLCQWRVWGSPILYKWGRRGDMRVCVVEDGCGSINERVRCRYRSGMEDVIGGLEEVIGTIGGILTLGCARL